MAFDPTEAEQLLADCGRQCGLPPFYVPAAMRVSGNESVAVRAGGRGAAPTGGPESDAANDARIQYPNGRYVHYTRPADSIDDALSRITAVKADDGSGDPGDTLSIYRYTGGGRIVEEEYDEPDVKLSYVGATTGDYSGFDRFGRVTWQTWKKTTGSTVLDRFFYGYDRNSNRIWRAERKDPNAVGGRDEAYAYDDLNRLTGAKRGILPSPGSYQAPYPGDLDRDGDVDFIDYSDVLCNYNQAKRAWAQGELDGDGTVGLVDSTIVSNNQGTPSEDLAIGWSWTLDDVGNWTQYQVDANGDGDYGDAGDTDESRTHNLANEITEIDSSADHIAHDAAGNMTKVPVPGDAAHHYVCIYDAWNRLVKVTTDATPAVTLAEYRYDGAHRRIAKLTYDATNEDWDRTDYYYTAAWQVVEERLAPNVSDQSKGNVATDAKVQYVWSQRYIDACILRDEDTDNDGDCTDAGGSERLYYCNGANMEVTCLLDTDGDAVERYVYSPYGEVTIYDDDWSDEVTWANSVKNEVLYAGYRYNPETTAYQVGFREYWAHIGRWGQRDPLGYADGMCRFAYVGANPVGVVDPDGLKPANPTDSDEKRTPEQNRWVKRWRREIKLRRSWFQCRDNKARDGDKQAAMGSCRKSTEKKDDKCRRTVNPKVKLDDIEYNGCGPGGGTLGSWLASGLIPNEVEPVGPYLAKPFNPDTIAPPPEFGVWDFTYACHAHDICYATCCAKRSLCDDFFYKDLARVCSDWLKYRKKHGFSILAGYYERQAQTCKDVANLYYYAVHKGGEDAYWRGQEEVCNCACKTTPAPKK